MKCRTNISANIIHNEMESLIRKYSVILSLLPFVKEKLYGYVNEIIKEKGKQKGELLSQKKQLEDRLNRLESKFIDDEVDVETVVHNLGCYLNFRNLVHCGIKGDFENGAAPYFSTTVETFRKHQLKLTEELTQIFRELNKSTSNTSNLCIYIDNFLEIASNSHILWEKGDVNAKKKLLKLLFPGGIVYNKKTGENRTVGMNSIFSLTRSIIEEYEGKKRGKLSRS
jgi:hypothetical protein